jgi:hypothetical protein
MFAHHHHRSGCVDLRRLRAGTTSLQRKPGNHKDDNLQHPGSIDGQHLRSQASMRPPGDIDALLALL